MFALHCSCSEHSLQSLSVFLHAGLNYLGNSSLVHAQSIIATLAVQVGNLELYQWAAAARLSVCCVACCAPTLDADRVLSSCCYKQVHESVHSV